MAFFIGQDTFLASGVTFFPVIISASFGGFTGFLMAIYEHEWRGHVYKARSLEDADGKKRYSNILLVIAERNIEVWGKTATTPLGPILDIHVRKAGVARSAQISRYSREINLFIPTFSLLFLAAFKHVFFLNPFLLSQVIIFYVLIISFSASLTYASSRFAQADIIPEAGEIAVQTITPARVETHTLEEWRLEVPQNRSGIFEHVATVFNEYGYWVTGTKIFIETTEGHSRAFIVVRPFPIPWIKDDRRSIEELKQALKNEHSDDYDRPAYGKRYLLTGTFPRSLIQPLADFLTNTLGADFEDLNQTTTPVMTMLQSHKREEPREDYLDPISMTLTIPVEGAKEAKIVKFKIFRFLSMYFNVSVIRNTFRIEIVDAGMSEATAHEWKTYLETQLHRIQGASSEIIPILPFVRQIEARQPLQAASRVDEAWIAHAQESLQLCEKFHGSIDANERDPSYPKIVPQIRKRDQSPYVAHLLRVAWLMLALFRNRHPGIQLASKKHDLREDAWENLLKGLGIEPDEATEEEIQQVHAIVTEAILGSFPDFGETLIGYLSDLSKHESDRYIDELMKKGDIGLLVIKVADALDNLMSIWDVDKPGFAQKTVAKQIRNILPLVMQIAQRTDAYKAGLRVYLAFFILLSDQLPTFQAFYWDNKKTKEDRQSANTEIVDRILSFGEWFSSGSAYEPLEELTQILGNAEKAKAMLNHFREKLFTLGNEISGDNALVSHDRYTEPTYQPTKTPSPPAGSIYRVFEWLVKHPGLWSADQIAEGLGLRSASIKPDLSALHIHFNAVRKDELSVEFHYELFPWARNASQELLGVFLDLYQNHGYRPDAKALSLLYKYKVTEVRRNAIIQSPWITNTEFVLRHALPSDLTAILNLRRHVLETEFLPGEYSDHEEMRIAFKYLMKGLVPGFFLVLHKQEELVAYILGGYYFGNGADTDQKRRLALAA